MKKLTDFAFNSLTFLGTFVEFIVAKIFAHLDIVLAVWAIWLGYKYCVN